MTKSLAVDRLGRVVLPKALRERYGLAGGAELELTDTGDGILLTPRRATAALTRLKNGFPVLSLAGRTDIDLGALIERTREERDERNRRSRTDADDDG
jgi:AbrB family looped-hinge helix DNA binding protein